MEFRHKTFLFSTLSQTRKILDWPINIISFIAYIVDLDYREIY